MVDFKKRALILTLAATVSVTGSFAANNYKNCLMNMKFTANNDKTVNLILDTKTPYEGTISPIRRDSSTYIIMLPEVDNESPTPDLSETGSCIKSVEVKKMPYSNGSKGYTKILIKTSDNISLNTTTALYVPSENIHSLPVRNSNHEDNMREVKENSSTAHNTENVNKSYNQMKSSYSNGRRYEDSSEQDNNETTEPVEEQTNENISTIPEDNNPPADSQLQEEPITTTPMDDSSHQQFLLGLLVLFVIMTSVYFYMRAQDKLTNVMGEKFTIDLEDDSKEKKKESKRKRKIVSTINKLNAEYSRNSKVDMKSYMDTKNVPTDKQEEELNVVDLDVLYKEKQTNSTEQTTDNIDESNALDEFLSGFQFDDEEVIAKLQSEEETYGYNEDDYINLINNKNIRFSKDDIDCFNELLRSEVSDDTIQNITNYALSNPIEPKKPSKDKILENLVTDYVIKQNITFTSEDISVLKKLVSVEIDPSFIYDLRTNHQLTDNMYKSMANPDTEKHNSSEIVTLSVKNMLPNLSKELKKQGNKPIKSEVKPETVYYSEGYEVNTLSLDIDLPDFSKELKNKHAYNSKPSHVADTVDNSYSDSVEKISISGLPDLNDVIANPKKYEEKAPEEIIVDENALLNSIMNVQFKPFDDGTRSFEIINNPDDQEETEEQPIRSFADIQNEFKQFENFEVTESEEIEKTYVQNDYDDFEALYNAEFVNLDTQNNNKSININEQNQIMNEPEQKINPDKQPETQKIQKESKKIKHTITQNNKSNSTKFVPQNLERKPSNLTKRAAKEKSEKLLQMLDKLRKERKEVKPVVKEKADKNTSIKPVKPSSPIVKCILEGVNYDVVDSVVIKNNIGCHLAKSEQGYKVLAYHDNELSVLKEYDSLKNEKIQSRLSETLSDGTPRFLIKVGSNKFIVDVKDNHIIYVMDL